MLVVWQLLWIFHQNQCVLQQEQCTHVSMSSSQLCVCTFFLTHQAARLVALNYVCFAIAKPLCSQLCLKHAVIHACFLQAFASPERLKEMVQKVQSAMQSSLPKAISKMKLYLNNPSTHSVLFKPIKSNIAEAHAQIAALLESEYTQQEVQSIQLTTPSALEKLLAL